MLDTTEEPLVTVIVSVLNGVKTIQRCIDSFSCQTYMKKELIVIDGGSSDGTNKIIKKNKAIIDYFESKPDRGICHAWNKALKHSHGDWILFIGADDYLNGNKALQKILPYLVQAFPDYSVVYGKVQRVNEIRKTSIQIGDTWKKACKDLWKTMPIPHQGVFHHRTLFERHGGFNENFQIVGDYEFILRELKFNPPMFAQNVIVAVMQEGGISTDLSSSIDVLFELRMAHEIHGAKVTIPSWLWNYSKARMKYTLINFIGKNLTRRLVNVYRWFVRAPAR